MIIIMMGPPGCGKGTQAKRVVKDNNIIQISTGDMIRAAIKNGTEYGVKAKDIVEKGGLVSDDVVIGIVKERIAVDDCKNGFILDGFPRTVGQAEALDRMLSDLGKKLDVVVNFELTNDIIIGRLTGRRTCKECLAGYHIKYAAPQKEGVCDKCGAELYIRPDDNEESITERLKDFKSKTSPLIDFYSSKGLVKSFDANGKPDDIYQIITNILKDL